MSEPSDHLLDLEFRLMEVNIIKKELEDILNNMDSGLVTVDRRLKLTDHFSVRAAETFGQQDLSGREITALVHPEDPKKQAELRQIFDLLFQERSSPETINDLLADDLVERRPPDGTPISYLKLRLHPIRDIEGGISYIIVSVNDVTREVELKQMLHVKRQESQENVVLLAILTEIGIDEFLNFVVDQIQFLEPLRAGLEAPEPPAPHRLIEWKRMLHTLKGDAGSFGLGQVEFLAHELESHLEMLDMTDPRDREKVNSCVSAIRKELVKMFEKIKQLTGQSGAVDWSSSILLPTAKLDELLKLARRQEPGRLSQDLIEKIEDLKCVPFGKIAARLPRMVRVLSERLQKEVAPLEVVGSDVQVNLRLLQRLGDVLVALVRNALDHGIEPPETRVVLGKPRQGRLRLEVARADGALRLTLSDDGAGIDVAALGRRAVQDDLLKPAQWEALSPHDRLKLIFVSGLSSRPEPEISMVSGRGFGMDAVKRTIDSLRGTIEIDSEPGRGTRFCMTVPSP